MKHFAFQHLSNQEDIVHGIFSRHQGVSKAPFHSCNISLGVGDKSSNVMANRQAIKSALAVDILLSASQVHGDRVYIVSKKSAMDVEVVGYDALISNRLDVGLMIQQADCQAIILFDPVNKAIANIHNGWRGSIVNIISKTITAMANEFGTLPSHLLAGIGPSLGPCCAEFINYSTELPLKFHSYQKTATYFDFWAISRDQLITAGVNQENIEIAEICTMCDHDYFSYRREGKTGRFASVIGLSSTQ